MITLERTGRQPLSFTGELVFHSHSRRPITGRDRYHTVTVWQTAEGCFVCMVHYITEWQGEHSDRHGFKVPTASRLAEELEKYDPVKSVVGFPAIPKYAERQRQLMVGLRTRYEDLVSRLLSDPAICAEESHV